MCRGTDFPCLDTSMLLGSLASRLYVELHCCRGGDSSLSEVVGSVNSTFDVFSFSFCNSHAVKKPGLAFL